MNAPNPPDCRQADGHDQDRDGAGAPDESGYPPPPAGAGPDTFPGDTGRLPLDTRRALVALLQGPSIDGRRQGRLWQVLLRDEAPLRASLHELFLELVVDREQRVAFTRQVVAPEIDPPILLRRMHLTFLESVLVLHLRLRLTQADTQGERAVLSRQEMTEHLRVFERDRNVDHARFDRQMSTAIEKAKKLNFIQMLRGSDERYEVSPTLKLLFPAEEIQALTQVYAALAQGDAGASVRGVDAAAASGEGGTVVEADDDFDIDPDAHAASNDEAA